MLVLVVEAVRDSHMQCRVSEVRRGGLLATSEAPLGC